MHPHLSSVSRASAQRRMGLPTVVAVVGLATCMVASSCGQPTPSAVAPTPAAVATLASTPPPGGHVPAAMIGDWFQPRSVVKDFDGNAVCVLLRLTLTATTYQFTHTALQACGVGITGDVVVHNSEIDFFNEASPGDAGPCADVGRYTWKITSGLLYFTLISDRCRAALRLPNGWSRTP